MIEMTVEVDALMVKVEGVAIDVTEKVEIDTERVGDVSCET
jgi:hypothetical protein